jgi:hypothetical protein
MSESYEKRARERRKQKQRREKLERKRDPEQKDDRPIPSDREWIDGPDYRPDEDLDA